METNEKEVPPRTAAREGKGRVSVEREDLGKKQKLKRAKQLGRWRRGLIL